METKHLTHDEWRALLAPRLHRLSPGTREALESGNASFVTGGVTYTTTPIRPITGPTHHIEAQVVGSDVTGPGLN